LGLVQVVSACRDIMVGIKDRTIYMVITGEGLVTLCTFIGTILVVVSQLQSENKKYNSNTARGSMHCKAGNCRRP
jgi:hypothetical protein